MTRKSAAKLSDDQPHGLSFVLILVSRISPSGAFQSTKRLSEIFQVEMGGRSLSGTEIVCDGPANDGPESHTDIP